MLSVAKMYLENVLKYSKIKMHYNKCRLLYIDILAPLYLGYTLLDKELHK